MIPEEFTRYARAAASDIDDKGARHDAESEILDHLLTIQADLVADGAPDHEAAQQALVRMGAAETVARPLGRANSPRPRVAAVAAIAFAALLLGFALWLAFYLAFRCWH